MSDLDVSLRLRLINLMAGGASEAIGDLRRVQQQAEKLNNTKASGGKVPDMFWSDQKKQVAEAQVAVDKYFSNIERRLAHLGMASMGFSELQRIGESMGKPIDEATASAVEFEKRIQSIAKAGGLLGKEGAIGDSILRAAKAGNIDWKELAKGERQMVALGGGEYLEKLAPVRERLAKLIKASEADAGDLYNLMYHYMHLLHMSPQAAEQAAEGNYQQGKKGAFELKDLAEVMPRLIPLGQEYMSDKQVSTDLVALLQILRKQTGSASEAETRARHAMTKLSDPAEATRIQKELGLDVYKIRADAKAKGENQLFAVLDAISAKFKEMGDAAGHVKESPEGPDHEGTVEGADPKKLGGIARDYYFRAALEAYMKMKDELKDYMPSEAEATKATASDFAATVSTTAAALERLGIAAEEAAIRAGNTQLGLEKWAADQKTKVANATGTVAENAPGTTGALMAAWNAIAKIGDLIGAAGNTAIGGATALLAMQYTMGKIAQWLSSGTPAAGASAAPAVAGSTEAAAASVAEVATSGSRLAEIIDSVGAAAVRMVGLVGTITAISDAFDDHQTNAPGFKEKIHADEAEEDKRKREGNGWNAVMRPDAANAVEDFFARLKGWVTAAPPTPSGGAPGAANGGPADAAGAQIGQAIADAAQKGASNVDMSPAAQATMSKYAGAIQGAEGPAIAAVEAFVAKLKAILDFTATPTIQPRLVTPSGATPSGGSSGPTPKKQARAGGNVYIAKADFHGVNDPKKLHEQVMARADRDAASANAGSLHDIDTGGVG